MPANGYALERAAGRGLGRDAEVELVEKPLGKPVNDVLGRAAAAAPAPAVPAPIPAVDGLADVVLVADCLGAACLGAVLPGCAADGRDV